MEQHLEETEVQKPYVKRNMSLIISNQFLATIAESIFQLMIIWFIYERTGSALYASGVMAVIMVTQIFVGPFMGVFVDRFEPKRAMQIGYGIMVLVGVFLTISYIVAPSFIVLSIYIALILHNICAQWIGPAKSKLLPRIVGNPNVVKTNGLLSSTGQTADLLGQSVSGFLIAFIGFVGIVLLHSGVYLIASFLLIFVIDLTRKKQDAPNDSVETSSKKRFFIEMREGYYILKENRPVFKSILLASALNLVTVASALTVVLVSDRYGASAVQFGIFNACGALGGIITGLFIGKLMKKAAPMRLFALGLFLSGLALIGVGWTTNLIIGTIFMAFFSASLVLVNVVLNSMMMILIKDSHRGRVFTLVAAIGGIFVPFAALSGGFLVDVVGIAVLFVASGIWLIAWSVLPIVDRDLKQVKLD